MHEPVYEEPEDPKQQSRDRPDAWVDEHQAFAFALTHRRIPVDSNGKEDVETDKKDVEYQRDQHDNVHSSSFLLWPTN